MDDIITLDYGSGGKKTAALIDEIIIPELGNNTLNALGDGAILDGQLAFSTDSFVVDPLFFPGGEVVACLAGLLVMVQGYRREDSTDERGDAPKEK